MGASGGGGDGDRGDAATFAVDMARLDDGTRVHIGSWLGRQFVLLLGVTVAAVMFAISGFMNFRFGMTLGTEPFDQWLYGFASLTADGFKALMPVIILGLWAIFRRGPDRRGDPAEQYPRGVVLLLIGAATVIWLLCTAWSLASAMGFATSTRDVTAATREATNDERQALRDRAERLEGQIALLPAHRPVGAVQAAIANADIPRNIWNRTRQCTDVTIPESLRACQPVLDLRRELAVAEDAARLEERLFETRRALSGVAIVGERKDPQAETISGVIGYDTATVKSGLAVLITLLIEAGSSLGVTLVWLGAGQLPVKRSPRKLKLSKEAEAAFAEELMDHQLAGLRLKNLENQAKLAEQQVRYEAMLAEAMRKIAEIRRERPVLPPPVEISALAARAKRLAQTPAEATAAIAMTSIAVPTQEDAPQRTPGSAPGSEAESTPEDLARVASGPPALTEARSEAEPAIEGTAEDSDAAAAAVVADSAQPGDEPSDAKQPTTSAAQKTAEEAAFEATINQDPTDRRPEDESQDPADDLKADRAKATPAPMLMRFFKRYSEDARRKLPAAEQEARQRREAAAQAAEREAAAAELAAAQRAAAEAEALLAREQAAADKAAAERVAAEKAAAAKAAADQAAAERAAAEKAAAAKAAADKAAAERAAAEKAAAAKAAADQAAAERAAAEKAAAAKAAADQAAAEQEAAEKAAAAKAAADQAAAEQAAEKAAAAKAAADKAAAERAAAEKATVEQLAAEKAPSPTTDRASKVLEERARQDQAMRAASVRAAAPEALPMQSARPQKTVVTGAGVKKRIVTSVSDQKRPAGLKSNLKDR